MMNKVLQGVVHGQTIELAEDLGVADGCRVEVVVRIPQLPGPPPGWKPDGNQTAAGMMAADWTDEDDRILEEIYQDRKHEPRGDGIRKSAGGWANYPELDAVMQQIHEERKQAR